jgi:hypothetical protein
MENILDKIVHKLWMIDHHQNEPAHIREIFDNVHLSWLRENLDELGVDSAHIKKGNLREFAIEAFLKNGVIYNYNPSPKKCLSPVEIDHFEKKDFAAQTLEKTALLQIYQSQREFLK